MRARWAHVWPAVVRLPWRRRAPREDTLGVRPSSLMGCLGYSQWRRSPSAARRGTAPVHEMPRIAWRAWTTGGQMPPLDRCTPCGLKVLEPFLMGRYGADVCLADQLQRGRGTDHVRPRRGADPQVARSSDRRSCRRRKAFSRDLAAWRSQILASRARVKVARGGPLRPTQTTAAAGASLPEAPAMAS